MAESLSDKLVTGGDIKEALDKHPQMVIKIKDLPENKITSLKNFFNNISEKNYAFTMQEEKTGYTFNIRRYNGEGD